MILTLIFILRPTGLIKYRFFITGRCPVIRYLKAYGLILDTRNRPFRYDILPSTDNWYEGIMDIIPYTNKSTLNTLAG